MAPLWAMLFNAATTAVGPLTPLREMRYALSPVMCGVAMEVPDKTSVAELLPM